MKSYKKKIRNKEEEEKNIIKFFDNSIISSWIKILVAGLALFFFIVLKFYV